MNIALNKKIKEKNWKRPEVLTNGKITGYTGHEGFSNSHWPTYLTVDLEKSYNVKLIRFLLWDNKGNPSNKRNYRTYYYRLLLSNDFQNWTTIYDSHEKGYNGWQEFIFEEKIPCRYIRIHCLYNTANKAYHIVELQAFEEIPAKLTAEVTFSKSILSIKELSKEIGDGLPISNQLESIAMELKEVSVRYALFNNERIKDLIDSLKYKAKDVETIERSFQAIRNQIIEPVNKELNFSNKIGRTSLILGIIGGIIGLISIIISIIQKIN